jgi:hypothetical protein
METPSQFRSLFHSAFGGGLSSDELWHLGNGLLVCAPSGNIAGAADQEKHSRV